MSLWSHYTGPPAQFCASCDTKLLTCIYDLTRTLLCRASINNNDSSLLTRDVNETFYFETETRPRLYPCYSLKFTNRSHLRCTDKILSSSRYII